MTENDGIRCRIGFLLPAVNAVVEPDCAPLAPSGVSNHVARIAAVEQALMTDSDFDAYLAAMRPLVQAALDQVMWIRPAHLILASALEALWGGVVHASSLQRRLETASGVGVSTGGTAMIAALQAVGARRIAIVTSSMPHNMVRRFFEEAGYDVVRLVELKRGSSYSVAATPIADLRAAFQEAADSDVDAIVQCGTNVPAKGLAVAAELWLGKPVLAMNVVTYWDALRRVGIQDRMSGHGLILEQF